MASWFNDLFPELWIRAGQPLLISMRFDLAARQQILNCPPTDAVHNATFFGGDDYFNYCACRASRLRNDSIVSGQWFAGIARFQGQHGAEITSFLVRGRERAEDAL